MKFLKKFALLAICCNSYAFDCESPVKGYHIGTIHSDRNANYRSDNAGKYFICRNGLTGGFYSNSEYKNSSYIGYTHQFSSRFAVSGVLISGYETEPIPALIPSFRIFDGIRLMYLTQNPDRENDTTGLHISYELNF